MAVATNSKLRGAVKLTYEALALVLGIEPGCIRAVIVRPETEVIEVVHDDGRLTSFEMIPGSHVPAITPIIVETHSVVYKKNIS